MVSTATSLLPLAPPGLFAFSSSTGRGAPIAMAPLKDSSAGNTDYLIFRHEKMGILDILGLLFTTKRLTDYDFVECSPQVAAELGKVRGGLVVLLVFVLQKILALISTPLKWIGLAVEFLLNLLSLNGGILGLIWHFITCSITIPDRNKASFRTMIAQIDGRLDLYENVCRFSSRSLLTDGVLPARSGECFNELLDLTMMAAKVSYENEAYIKDAVNNHWKMYFVKYFDCWNRFLSKKTTQAFIFCDKEVDAKLICVAFRGTEPFDAEDWSTDVELSWISMGNKMGRVHLGFMKALGLQDEKGFATGFPVDQPAPVDPEKPLAYYAIREELKTLLKAHPKAKVVVTGHSLGAALACLFPSLLVYHGQAEVLGRIARVVTHAQPRVGDETFATYMEFMGNLTYDRVVYRYDIVPRVPFDLPSPLSAYKHFGTCIYYKSWRDAKVVVEVPNRNYFNPLHVISMYWHAWGDLIKAFFIGWVKGKDFKEGWVSISFRALGLLIPGLASHSPRDYVNGARLSKIALNSEDIDREV